MNQSFWFNIGNLRSMASHQDWWDYLRNEGIITLGFGHKSPDFGERKIQSLPEGSLILAYASGCGPLGYGTLGSKSTYRYATDRTDMRHERSIAWSGVIEDLFQSNSSRLWLSEFGLKIPRQTVERFENEVGVDSFRSYFDARSAGGLTQEAIESPSVFLEGAARQRLSTTHERNPLARAKCLEAFGHKCAVCDFDFEAVYGKAGQEFIHVHHLIKIADIGEEYEINPITDLRPVCANCHAIIHRRRDHYSIEEMREMIFDVLLAPT